MGQAQKSAVFVLFKDLQSQGRQCIDFRDEPIMLVAGCWQQQVDLTIQMLLQAQESVMCLFRCLLQQLLIGDVYHAGEDSIVSLTCQPFCVQPQARALGNIIAAVTDQTSIITA